MAGGILDLMQQVRLNVVRGPTKGTLLAVFVLLFAPLALPQEKLVTSQEANERIRQLSMLSQVHQAEYVIGSGDLLTIQVFDVAELSRDVRVSEQGTIALPLLPSRLHAAGLTERQLEQKLEEVLSSSGLVSRPQISITVKERRSNPITVIGAVAHPMVYQAVRAVTLLEVLSEAGGIAGDAGSTVLITRGSVSPKSPDPVAPEATAPGMVTSPAPTVRESEAVTPNAPAPGATGAQSPGPTGTQESVLGASASDADPASSTILTVNLTDLLDSGDPKYNIPLQGGDVVSVPKAGIVYVIGAVERPGGFVLSNDREAVSVLKVMALSGGPKSTARQDQCLILRKGSRAGPQKEIPLNLKKLMQHQAEDVRLSAGDIFFVPESGGKKAARRLGEVAIALGTGVALFRLGR
ncbi:MAG TPA: polysaccharide biosynthesis/export family protein [Candidatus Dormibacteraeota bacterium]|nr:polysaccharide biosynthesis/export family protein [Candidatus Dormibacteraeota bacterium]